LEYSEDELRLLHALQVSPRASWVDLSEALNMSPRQISSMYTRLHDSKELWITAAAGKTTLDSTCLAFVEFSCLPGQIRNVAEALADIPNVITIQLLSGDWDIGCLALYPGVVDAVGPLLDEFGNIEGVRGVRSSLATQVFDASNRFRLQSLNPSEVAAIRPRPIRNEVAIPRLDEADRKIVDCLQLDGRAPFTGIADRLNLSSRTVERRFSRLVESGLIILRCDFSRVKAGLGTAVIFRLHVPDNLINTVGETLVGLPETRTCAVLATTPNFFWSVGVRSLPAVQRLKTHISKALPEVKVVEQLLVLRQHKLYGRVLDDFGAWVKFFPFISALLRS
jgi:DNA-binding Lrp family transcriptional regulator